ncbi:MAG: Xaa-Pro peptidase family protein [Bryobacterales bacterium]|nr:Xaa-Pro peptidase family protein [Bryobacterales bacterium]
MLPPIIAPQFDSDRGSILGYADGLLRTRRAFLAACAALPCARAAGPIDAGEYAERRRALAEAIGRGVIALLGSTESEGRSGFTGFRQQSSFFYLTGHQEPGAALLIAPAHGGRPYREILFLADSASRSRKWSGPSLQPENAGHLGFAEVLTESRFRPTLSTLLRDRGRLAGLAEARPADDALARSRHERLVEAAGSEPTRDIRVPLAALRSVKSPAEIALIQASIEATEVGFRDAWAKVADGATERDVAAGLIGGAFRAGCERLAFAPIVAAGAHATILHYQRNSGRLQNGQMLLIDAGGERARYAADITRSIPVSGQFSEKQRQLYEAVLEAHEQALNAVKPGAVLSGPARSSIESIAQRVLRRRAPRGADPYLPHAIGHHVGLDVHDPTPPGRAFEPGMVLAIEPGLYLPEEGIGIRIEDMVEVTVDGCRVMSTGLPRSADALEAALAGAGPD